MVRRTGGRAGTRVVAHALRALAADIFVGLLAHLAFRERGYVRRDAISHPMEHTKSATPFWIHHCEREALGASRHARPRQLRRNIVANAVRILRVLVGGLARQHLAVFEGLRGERKNLLRLRRSDSV